MLPANLKDSEKFPLNWAKFLFKTSHLQRREGLGLCYAVAVWLYLAGSVAHMGHMRNGQAVGGGRGLNSSILISAYLHQCRLSQ